MLKLSMVENETSECYPATTTARWVIAAGEFDFSAVYFNHFDRAPQRRDRLK